MWFDQFPVGHEGGQGKGHSSGFKFPDKIEEAHGRNQEYYAEKWGGLIGKRWCGEPQPGNFQKPCDGKLSTECMSMLSQYHREQNENLFKPHADTVVTARKTHSFGLVESPWEAATRKGYEFMEELIAGKAT